MPTTKSKKHKTGKATDNTIASATAPTVTTSSVVKSKARRAGKAAAAASDASLSAAPPSSTNDTDPTLLPTSAGASVTKSKKRATGKATDDTNTAPKATTSPVVKSKARRAGKAAASIDASLSAAPPSSTNNTLSPTGAGAQSKKSKKNRTGKASDDTNAAAAAPTATTSPVVKSRARRAGKAAATSANNVLDASPPAVRHSSTNDTDPLQLPKSVGAGNMTKNNNLGNSSTVAINDQSNNITCGNVSTTNNSVGDGDEVLSSNDSTPRLVKIVDRYCTLRNGNIFVVEDFDATLNQVDIDSNANKFYRIQLLRQEMHNKKDYFLWTRWGRVGEEGKGSLLGPYDSQAHGEKEFQTKFREKTGVKWSEKFNSVGKKGKYEMLSVQNEVIDTAISQDLTVHQSSHLPSKLPDDTQNLIKLIFDVKMFTSTMKEMNIDLSKMPLGQLNASQIEKGFVILEQIKTLINNSSGSFVHPDAYINQWQ